MKMLLKNFLLGVSIVRLLPIGLAYFIVRNVEREQLIVGDINRWANIRKTSLPISSLKWVNAARLLTFVPEFRNILYHRLGVVGRVVKIFARPLPTLYIHTRDIGPGFYIQHGFGTIISARRIGSNCWVNQGVTLGYSNDTDCPSIGDDVTISAGAKIIGAVTVGDRSKIGANAVVVKDIPADATAVGVPARVVKLKGERVNQD
jgi:serine O-acetyltransferase